MNHNLDHNLRDYAAGALTGTPLQEFERRLQNEPDLQAELDLYLSLKAAENLRLKQQLSDQVAAEGLQPAVPPKAIARHLPLWFAIAASIALILTATWWWFNQSPKPDAVALAQTYISSPYPSPVSTMGEADTLSAALQRAFLAYRNEDFASAAVLLSAVASQTDPSDQTLFYAGEALLQTGQWTLAIQHFERVRPGYWREIADWRCALAYIKIGQASKARPILEKLRNGSRRTQVENLLKTLE